MNKELVAKWLAMLAVVGGLAVAMGWVQGVVQGRAASRDVAANSVADGLAGAQTLAGPWVQRDCTFTRTELETDLKGRTTRVVRTSSETSRHLATALSGKGGVDVTQRKRGIFKVPVYGVQLAIEGGFAPLALPVQPSEVAPESAGASPYKVACTNSVVMGVSDPRGIRSVQFAASGTPLAVLPGTALSQLQAGVHVRVSDETLAAGLKLSVALELAGTQALEWVPSAEQHAWALTGNWPHASYSGNFLPTAQQSGESGFEAKWAVSALSSGAPEKLGQGHAVCQSQSHSNTSGDAYESTRGAVHAAHAAAADAAACVSDRMGLRLIDPVDHYALADRASKYGILFVALTFAAVALVELIARVRVHPVQYLLVGAALCTFFLLLVSLSELLGFKPAYAAAAAACVLLLGGYGVSALQSTARGLQFGAGMALLYGALYLLLQLEQVALLAGSVMLFVAVAVVMRATSGVKWYGKREAETATAAG